jgi:hypothetical protein
MADDIEDVLDSLFHGCALAAYVDQAALQQGRPDSVATRQRAYDYYENALAEKNRRKTGQPEQGEDQAQTSATAPPP